MTELMTVREVADMLRLSQRQVRDLIKRQDIAAVRIGRTGSIRVPASAVASLLIEYVPPVDPKAPTDVMTIRDMLTAAGVRTPSRSAVLHAANWLKENGAETARKANVKGYKVTPGLLAGLKREIEGADA